MLIQDRVRMIIKANNLSASEFADEIGVKRSNLSHVLNGRNKPGLDFLSKIVSSFPNVDAAWLLTGEQSKPIEKVEEKKSGFSFVKRSSEKKTETSTSNGDIDRIIIFYKDGTFNSYRSNEQ